MTAGILQRNGVEVRRIESPDGAGAAEIAPSLGGFVTSWTTRGGVERLYLHDHAWDPSAGATRGGMPFLFPICGRLRLGDRAGAYRHGGREYELGLHGFSEWLPWDVVESAGDRLTIRLCDTDATRERYPFRFEVALTYRVEAEALVTRMVVANRGSSPMPYYAGFHPYLAVRGGATVTANAVRRHRYNETLDQVVGEEPCGEVRLASDEPSFNRGLFTLAEPWSAQCAGVELRVVSPTPGLFRFLQLYALAGKPFVCVEPWMGHANLLNEGGARALGAGEEDTAVFRMRVAPSGGG